MAFSASARFFGVFLMWRNSLIATPGFFTGPPRVLRTASMILFRFSSLKSPSDVETSFLCASFMSVIIGRKSKEIDQKERTATAIGEADLTAGAP